MACHSDAAMSGIGGLPCAFLFLVDSVYMSTVPCCRLISRWKFRLCLRPEEHRLICQIHSRNRPSSLPYSVCHVVCLPKKKSGAFESQWTSRATGVGAEAFYHTRAERFWKSSRTTVPNSRWSGGPRQRSSPYLPIAAGHLWQMRWQHVAP